MNVPVGHEPGSLIRLHIEKVFQPDLASARVRNQKSHPCAVLDWIRKNPIGQIPVAFAQAVEKHHKHPARLPEFRIVMDLDPLFPIAFRRPEREIGLDLMLLAATFAREKKILPAQKDLVPVCQRPAQEKAGNQ